MVVHHIFSRIAATGAILLAGLGGGAGCTAFEPNGVGASYQSDLTFLGQHTRVMQLEQDGARIAIAPQLQGRVMTAAFDPRGLSLGWVNRAAVRAGEHDVPFNMYGGSDRFWLTPEGGPFSVFFEPGEPQDVEHWQTPPGLNKGAFEVDSTDCRSVRMRKAVDVANASGTKIELDVQRTIRMLTRFDAGQLLGTEIPGELDYIGHVSENRITNRGRPLTEKSGAVGVWSVGMFPARASTVVIIPFNKKGDGVIVESSYFGEIPRERLLIDDEHGVVLFKGDARYRSKIGLSVSRAKDRLAGVDFANNVLTIVHFDRLPGRDTYLCNLWKNPNDRPYVGDVLNAYNHHGENNEVFYELESTSPAAFLEPGESSAHYHRTFHFTGSAEALSQFSEKALGVSLEHVRRRIP